MAASIVNGQPCKYFSLLACLWLKPFLFGEFRGFRSLTNISVNATPFPALYHARNVAVLMYKVAQLPLYARVTALCTMHYIVSLEAASFGTIGLRYPFMICLLRDTASQVTTFNSRTAVQRRNCLERLRVRHRSATNCPTELSRLLFLNRSYVRVVTFVSFTFGKVYCDYDTRTDDNRLI